MNHSIRPLTLSERLEAVHDYRKAEEYARSRGDEKTAKNYANLADGYDPYYIVVDIDCSLLESMPTTIPDPETDQEAVDNGW